MDSLFENNIDFLLQPLSVDIGEFRFKRTNSLEWLKSNTHKITVGSKMIFDYFFKINSVTVDAMPQYHASPYWGEVTNNYKMRFLIIKDKQIYHLVLLRIIGIMYHEQYVCVTYNVLSSNGKVSTDTIMPLLRNIDCIKKVERIVDKDTDWDNCNFYCTPENITNISTKRRTQMTRAFKLLDKGVKAVALKSLNSELVSQCNDLFGMFVEYRFKFNKKVNAKMVELVSKDNIDTIIVFSYNNKIIGIQVACNDFLDVASIHVAKDISSFPIDVIATNYTNNDYELAKEIRNYLGILREEYTKRHCLGVLKFPAVYIDGAHGDKNKYLIHKRKHYDKCIYYKMVDINEI